MITKKTIRQVHPKRVARIRAVVKGSQKRPRVCMYRSHTTLYGQFIDDVAGKTVATCRVKGTNISCGKKLGQDLAEKAKTLGIDTVVFDRSGYKYHGVIQAVADAMRQGGIHI